MSKTSFALPVRSLMLIALVAVTLAPATRNQVADLATISDRASADRADAAPIVLAGRCYVVNGRWVCF